MASQYSPPPYYMPPLPPYERPPSWLARHRKLVIAGGCALVLFVFLVAAGFVAAIAYGVMSLVKSSGAYRNAVELARQNAGVQAALGQPIEEGWFVTGSVRSAEGAESADLVIPLSGPRGEATLYVTGRRDGARWHYSVLEVEITATGERIPLAAASGSPDAASPGVLPAEPAPDELPADVTQ